jgi:ParB family chromosome partitioning protein
MKLLEQGSFPIAEIEIGQRLRPVDPDWVAVLAEMIKAAGLQHPIEIARVGNRHVLVAGAHRVAAYKLLGLNDIPARVMLPETDKPQSEIRFDEIVENIGRRDLAALDRAGHLAELHDLWLELYPERGRGGDRKSAKFKEKSKVQSLHSRLVADTAHVFNLTKEVRARTGFSRRTFFAALQMWNGLTAHSRTRLRGTKFADNHAQLALLAQKAASEQNAVLDLLLGKEPKAATVADAILIIEKRPKPKGAEKLYSKFQKAWLDADAPTRRKMLLMLQGHGARISERDVTVGEERRGKA